MKKVLIIFVVLVILGAILPNKESENTSDTENKKSISNETTSAPTKSQSDKSADSSSLPVTDSKNKHITEAITPTSSPTPKPTATPIPKPTATPPPKPKKLTGKLDEYEKDYYVFYVVNKNTKKFHYPYCRHVERMYESNANYATDHGFADANAARSWLIKHGYDPCGTCCP